MHLNFLNGLPVYVLGTMTCGLPTVLAMAPLAKLARFNSETLAKPTVLPAEIDADQESAVGLWRDRASPLIHLLPNDLIADIFVRVQLDSEMPLRSLIEYITKPVDLQWLRLARVCRRWHHLVHGTPKLWHDINMALRVDLVGLFLARSSPIPINIDFSTHPSPHAFKILPLHAHRIRALNFGGLGEKCYPDLAEFFTSDMPILEVVTFFEHTSIYDTPARRTAQIQWSSQRHPRLHTLSLMRTRAPQDNTMYSRLRVLSLSKCSYEESFHHFMDALSTSVRLEQLSLNVFLRHLRGDWTSVCVPCRTPLSLPRLRIVALHNDSADLVSRFLSHLTLPSDVYLRVCVPRNAARSAALASAPQSQGVLLPRRGPVPR